MLLCIKCGEKVLSINTKCPRCFSTGTLIQVPGEQKLLPDLSVEKSREKIPTGSEGFDQILDGGMKPGNIIVLYAQPGLGKTTKISQVAAYQVARGYTVSYFTGEEEYTQVNERAARLGISDKQPNLFFDYNIRELISEANRSKPDIMIIDSIQALLGSKSNPLSLKDQVSNMDKIKNITKKLSMATLVICHVRKDMNFAGPKAYEHYSDVFIEASMGNNGEIIFRNPHKNRQGPTGRRAVFRMTEQGVIDIDEKETGYFLRHKDTAITGLAAFMTEIRNDVTADEITVVEISNEPQDDEKSGSEAKKCPLVLDGGTRTHSEFLSAIIQMHFGDLDSKYIVRASMSDRIKKTADLAVIMAIMSKVFQIPIPREAVFIASVDASGRLLQVSNMNLLVSRAEKQGYTKVYGPMPIGSQKADWEAADTVKDVWDMVTQPKPEVEFLGNKQFARNSTINSEKGAGDEG